MDYSLEEDHRKLKKQIKEWELRIDALLNDDGVMIDGVAGSELTVISEEMMAINI